MPRDASDGVAKSSADALDENVRMLPSDAPRAQQHVILSIQYLRGIAAMMVVWFHSAEQLPAVSVRVPSTFGNSGVDLFFVISGFIMVVTTSGQSISPVEFMRRRVIRVAPLYWILTLAMVVVAAFAPQLFRTLIVTPLTLIESLFFIPHWSLSFPGMAWPLLVPGWTLNFEMFFYLLFALAIALPGSWRLPSLAAIFLLLVLVGRLFGPFSYAAPNVYTGIVMLEFVIGAAIGTWWLRARIVPARALSLLAIVLGFALLLARNAPPLGTGTQMIGAGLVVFGALHPDFSNLRLPLLRGLGDCSYSIYLTHLFALGALRTLWAHFIRNADGTGVVAGFMLSALIVCAGVGYATWRAIEIPLTRRLQALGRRDRPHRVVKL
jgi:exopolysaccharide production protein ExoZ